MTVEENLLLARAAGRPGPWTVDAVMTAFPNLAKRRRAKAGTLSGGEAQATAIGRSLMTNPDLLMLDEVSLGLSPLVVDQVYASLRSLMTGGTTVILVEQDSRAGAVGLRPRHLHARGAHRSRRRGARPRSRSGDERLFRPRWPPEGRVVTDWINQILQGVLLGGYYALIACGLSFMYGVMRIINLAHGSLAVLAAFGLFVLADRFAISPFLGLLIVLPAMALIGVLLQRLVLDRSLRGGLLVPLLSTFGLAIVNRQPAVRGLRRRHALARALSRFALLRFLGADRRHLRRSARDADLRDRGGWCSVGCTCS